MTFGLITEGPTDQVVLRNLLARYFSPDIDTRPVQPDVDATDKAGPGGWDRVLKYCKSKDMLSALEANDFVIIQIDTDCCEKYGVQKRSADADISADDIVAKTKAIIIEHIGSDLYNTYSQKVFFAISHDSIECWLLPLYFSDKRKTKTTNCCETLNQELQKGDFTIDCHYKQATHYNRIFKEKKEKIRNKALIESLSMHNNSFNQFIQSLATIEI